MKSIERIKQGDFDRLKDQYEQVKRRLKEVEEEKDELYDKNLALKKERSVLESQAMMFGDPGNSGMNDFEKNKLKENIEKLYDKLEKKKEKITRLDRENNFYHQTTTIFLTIKKVIEKEKKYCFMLATETDVLKKKQLMDAITMCGDKAT